MESHALKETLERLIAGTASADDRLSMQRALLEGKIVFEMAGGDAIIEDDLQKSLVITEDNNQAQVELGESTHGLLRERIFPSPPGIAPPFPALVFIGRENDLREVQERLGLANTASS